MSFFLNLPFYGLLIVLVFSSVLLTVLLTELVYRLVPADKRLSSNDVTAFLFSSLGIFSALVISAVLVMALDHFSDAGIAVTNEANMLADLDRVGRALSPEFGTALAEKIAVVAKITSVLEWDEPSKKLNTELEREAANEMAKFIGAYEPQTPREVNYHQAVIERLGMYYNARRARSSIANNSIAPQVLVVSLIVGFLTLVFALLYGAESKRMHLILVSLLTGAMATTFSLILVFDAPFQGDLIISNEPYLKVIINIKKNDIWDAQQALKVKAEQAVQKSN